jgi:hypothetical protein
MINLLQGTGERPDPDYIYSDTEDLTENNDGGTENCNGWKPGISYYIETLNTAFNKSRDAINASISDLLKGLSYSRQTINSCGLNVQNYTNINLPPDRQMVKLLSCEGVEDNAMPDVKKMGHVAPAIVAGQEYPQYCYGRNLGKILEANGKIPKGEELSNNWFCCIKNAAQQ